MPIFPDFLKPTQGQPGTDDVQLKKDRIAALHQHPNFEFSHFDLANCADTRHVFAKQQIHRVIHLAAQAGVRYSLINPQAYVHSNVVAFTNVLESVPAPLCRTPGLRKQFQRLRGQQEDAIFDSRQCGSSNQPLRCHQEGQ